MVVSAVAEHRLQGMLASIAATQSCSTRAGQLPLAGSRAQAQQPWRTGRVVSQHKGSSQTRDQSLRHWQAVFTTEPPRKPLPPSISGLISQNF